MDVKKRVGCVGILTVMALATGAGAEPVKAPVKAQSNDEQLSLKAGEVRSLKLANVNRIAIADPEIADVHVTGADVIQVKGIKKGETSLMVWMHDGKARKAYRVVVGG